MFDSDLKQHDKAVKDYTVGQDLYAASVNDMRLWVEALHHDIVRIEAEIEKKQQERLQADKIFKTNT
ncbi:MAG: DUF1192 family protein [Maricaulaceae bacterium]